eukprot:CAMPEP_0185727274 /NCGR_PEP_ID=MMETSP1171-20130828/3001_1 /TAXON_ID=374046 /ORGANISM="Helicotheca tamensis, Strain CCMP826" /LENGTH=468 /DNA_ID=CAMNT_0028395801 /DNA_START=72 /DNA_END=1478 /DNA_ORIENTATION=+
MKLTVKTLKGGKFTVDAEPSSTVAEVKGIIEAAKNDLPAANMKLIHSGKVLKDSDTIDACNIKPNDFLVVMITKAKKAAAAPAAAPAAATPKEEAKPAAAAPATAPAPAASEGASTSTEAAAPAAATPAPAATPAAAPPASDEFPAEVISNLTGMGFPEAEVRACLRASNGNPDVAVEFLMNGIPPGIPTGGQQAPAPTPSSGSGSDSASPLEGLRSHPQFDALRRLVQNNPSTLQAVLNQIGQQQPELLQAINANQAEFVRMMNEPITESTPAPAPANQPSTTTPTPAPTGGSSSSPAAGGMPPGLLAGMQNPAQMAQMIQNMNPDELNQMAQMMGLTPEQLTTTAQMIGQMPPEQFQEYMNMAMQGGGMGGLPGMGGAGGAGGEGGQPHVLRLTPEEIAAVDRLADMGFDRAEAAQAYLACDKNEALAANLLMDGGFGFGDADMGGSGGGGGGGSGNGDDGDDMYD